MWFVLLFFLKFIGMLVFIGFSIWIYLSSKKKPEVRLPVPEPDGGRPPEMPKEFRVASTRAEFPRNWWLGIFCDSMGFPYMTSYKADGHLHHLTLHVGVGHGCTGGTFVSGRQWVDNQRLIAGHLRQSGVEWFVPLFEKSLRGETFSEDDVLDAFRRHSGCEPVPYVRFSHPFEEFRRINQSAESLAKQRTERDELPRGKEVR